MAWTVFGYFGGQREEPTGAASAMRVNWQNDALAQFTGIRQHRDLDGLLQPELQRANARRVAHWPVVAGEDAKSLVLAGPDVINMCAPLPPWSPKLQPRLTRAEAHSRFSGSNAEGSR